MPYPGRPVLNRLPQFAGTNTTRPTPAQRQELIAFVGAEYAAGRSLRELAELTDRTQTAVRRALNESGMPRRPRGPYRVSTRTDS